MIKLLKNTNKIKSPITRTPLIQTQQEHSKGFYLKGQQFSGEEEAGCLNVYALWSTALTRRCSGAERAGFVVREWPCVCCLAAFCKRFNQTCSLLFRVLTEFLLNSFIPDNRHKAHWMQAVIIALINGINNNNGYTVSKRKRGALGGEQPCSVFWNYTDSETSEIINILLRAYKEG